MRPNLGTRTELSKSLKKTLEEISDSLLYWLAAEYKRQLPRIAQDAPPLQGYSAQELTSSNPPKSVYAAISQRFDAESKRWQKKGKESADRFSNRFMSKTQRDVARQMNNNFKAAGFKTIVKNTRASKAIFALQGLKVRGLVNDLVQRFILDTTAIALNDFINQEPPAALRKHVKKKLAVAIRKAGNLSRSVSANTTQTIAQAHSADLGLNRCIWIHVPGKKYSRRSHELMHGKEFDRAKGMWDPEVQRYVQPSEQMYCMCTYRVIAPDYFV